MNQSDSRDSAGQSADDVLKTSKHHADLRNRIAAVLYEDGQRPMNTAVRLADAVIREIPLQQDCGCQPVFPTRTVPSFDNGSRDECFPTTKKSPSDTKEP